MVVHNHDCGGACYHSRPKNLAGMHEKGIQQSNRYQLVPFDPTSSVQEQDHEAFAFRVEIWVRRHMQPPIFGGAVRCVTNLERFGKWTFAQRNYLVFLGWLRCIVHDQCGCGRDAIIGLWITVQALTGISAGVLPAFPLSIPMETEPFKPGSDFRFRRDIEFEPDPIADKFGIVPNFGHF